MPVLLPRFLAFCCLRCCCIVFGASIIPYLFFFSLVTLAGPALAHKVASEPPPLWPRCFPGAVCVGYTLRNKQTTFLPLLSHLGQTVCEASKQASYSSTVLRFLHHHHHHHEKKKNNPRRRTKTCGAPSAVATTCRGGGSLAIASSAANEQRGALY